MNSRRRTLGLLIGLSLLLGGPLHGPAASETSLKQAVDSIRRNHNISATGYVVVTSRSVQAIETLGTTDQVAHVPFRPDHLIRIGSITKTFTALATSILAEQNTLRLEQAVAALLARPPFDNPWANTNPVTIEQLLEHTAGLHDLSTKEFAFNTPVDLAKAFSVDPASRRIAWPPGSHSSYSNSGAGVVSAVIETVTGKHFADYVVEEIFEPLNMASATFVIKEDDRPRLATGYDRDGRTPIPYWHTLYPAFGGINVSVRDMIPFIQLFLNRGEQNGQVLLSRKAITRMEHPTTTLAARAGLTYGYGLGLYQFQHHGISFYGHGGDADGYLSFFAYSPQLQRGYFVVINAFVSEALTEMRMAIQDDLVGVRPVVKKDGVRLPSGQLALLSGEYLAVTTRFAGVSKRDRLIVIADDGLLYTSALRGGRRQLIAEGPWVFRRVGESVATAAFIPCGDRIYLQGPVGNFERRLANGQTTLACDGLFAQAVSTQRTPVPPIAQ
ncbi:MAG: CubicO group peptidase (beta-lactamase class C family) [Gammaproteobacteria bacterium]|jgi:CubicO group peptidase (beta-lactamase class C family)